MSMHDRLEMQPERPQALPGPQRYPVLGMLPHLRKGPHVFFLRTALQHGGVACLGRPDRLLVSHPDAVRHVLVENHRNYIKGKYTERLRILIGNGLPVADGESWLQQRRLMQPAFHRQHLAAWASGIADLTAATLEQWQRKSARPFDIAAEMRQLTQQIIVKLLFGAEVDSAEADAVGRAFAEITEYINYRETSLLPLPASWPIARHRRLKQAQRLLDQFVHHIIDQRRANASGDSADLISMLLAAQDEETGAGMSDQQLYDEVRTIFFGGYDTTSNALAWVWYLLAQHPDVEQRLQHELDTVLAGRAPAYQDLAKLTYLRMVIEEAMRLYPPAWITVRTVVADDQIHGYRVPAGAKVLISPYVTHRLPAFWEQPEAFDPERFRPERAGARHRGAYIPFGVGPRLCIGSNLAMLEAQLIVATMAQRYRLSLVPGHSVQARPGIILHPRYGIVVCASVR
jgi:cytochrome P450